MRLHRSCLLAWSLALLAAAGCGDDEGKVPRHPAFGLVVADGEPAEGVRIRLHPVDRLGDIDALRPYATTGADGKFRLGTYEDGDGAPVGRYKVTLFWPDPPQGSDRAVDLLGDRYALAEKSPLEVPITAGDNQLGPFQVEKTKASKLHRPSK